LEGGGLDKNHEDKHGSVDNDRDGVYVNPYRTNVENRVSS